MMNLFQSFDDGADLFNNPIILNMMNQTVNTTKDVYKRQRKIKTASSSVGSSTFTGWNLRSSAASFSIYLRYSSSVVAPINWISPLARDGFKMLEASIAPSAPDV